MNNAVMKIKGDLTYEQYLYVKDHLIWLAENISPEYTKKLIYLMDRKERLMKTRNKEWLEWYHHYFNRIQIKKISEINICETCGLEIETKYRFIISEEYYGVLEFWKSYCNECYSTKEKLAIYLTNEFLK